jgi:hypothetical protein
MVPRHRPPRTPGVDGRTGAAPQGTDTQNAGSELTVPWRTMREHVRHWKPSRAWKLNCDTQMKLTKPCGARRCFGGRGRAGGHRVLRVTASASGGCRFDVAALTNQGLEARNPCGSGHVARSDDDDTVDRLHMCWLSTNSCCRVGWQSRVAYRWDMILSGVHARRVRKVVATVHADRRDRAGQSAEWRARVGQSASARPERAAFLSPKIASGPRNLRSSVNGWYPCSARSVQLRFPGEPSPRLVIREDRSPCSLR